MTSLTNAIAQVLSEIDSGTLEEIIDELVRVRQPTEDEATVERALRNSGGRFAVDAEGNWSNARQLRPARPALPAGLRAPASRPAPAAPSTAAPPSPGPRRHVPRVMLAEEVLDLEDDLQRRLRDRRLVAEVGLDAALHEKVQEHLEQALAGRNRDDVLYRLPAMLSVYLVGHGVYHYDGAFWPSITVGGIDQQVGPAFEQSLKRLQLETFTDMVHGDGALRFVGPILAHGGVPKFSLPDYFGLLTDSVAVAGDAATLISRWRARAAAFVGIDAPVRRFLLFGGPLAVDFVDRTLDLMRAFATTGATPTPREIGLPRYMVRAFSDYVEASGTTVVDALTRARRSTNVSRSRPPVVLIDPWDGSGPFVELAPVSRGAAFVGWRVEGGGQFDRMAVSTVEARVVPLRPSRAWSVNLLSDRGVEHSHTFEGLGELPALFFDPSTSTLLRPAGGLRVDSVWILAPAAAVLEAVQSNGEVGPLRVIERLPAPGGAWSGYQLLEVDTREVRALEVAADHASKRRRISVFRPTERPGLTDSAVAGVTTAMGLPIYSEPPGIALPGESVSAAGNWQLQVAFDDRVRLLSLDELRMSDGTLRLPADLPPATDIRLLARGQLGTDLRVSFQIVPGLEITRPDRLLFPGDRAVLSVTGPSLAIAGNIVGSSVHRNLDPDADHAEFHIQVDGRDTDITVEVSRLLWTLLDPDDVRVTLAGTPVVLSADDIVDERRAALLVQTGQHDLDLRLELVGSGQAVLQASDNVRTAGTRGRWLFDLRRFRDTIALTDEAELSLRLFVGARPVTVGRIRRTHTVSGIQAVSRIHDDFTSVTLTFSEDRPLRNRVARLWSRNRPWQAPVTAPIPDGTTGRATIADWDVLPAGAYLAEIAVDDGWTALSRPTGEARNTAPIAVGDNDDIELRQRRLHDGDALDILELAASTGRIPRRVDADESRAIARELVVTLGSMFDGFALYQPDSIQAQAVRRLLSTSTDAVVEGVIVALGGRDISQRTALRLAILLAGRTKTPAAQPDDAMRSLWEACPPLAAEIDCCWPDLGARERLAQFPGWSPEVVLTSERPVDQAIVGRTADELESLRRQMYLLPKQILDIDTFAEANFAWLLQAHAAHEPIARWWHSFGHFSRIAERLDIQDAAVPFVKARISSVPVVAPWAGAGQQAPWASLPAATLGAAIQVVRNGDDRAVAERALDRATAFAPQLVARDLVLARVLSPVPDASTPREDPDVEPA